MNTTEIVKLAVDTYKNKQIKYSKDETLEALHNAFIKANNGSNKLDFRTMRDGGANGLFTLIEQILQRTAVEGLQDSDFFTQLVEYRNIGLGDSQIFEVEDNDLYFVARGADGVTVKRQKIVGVTETTIATQWYYVRIYEDASRLLAGRVNFSDFVTKVAQSFQRHILDTIYAVWANVTADELGGLPYVVTGTYDEQALLTLIEHVQAAAGGRPAIVMGTASALRNLVPSITGIEARSDLYNLGYFGKFYGNDVVMIPQRHKVNTTEFVFPDNVITVVAGGDRPIKFIYEGQGLIVNRPTELQRDLTQEYMYGEKFGVGIVMPGSNSGIGKYTFT